MVVDLERGRRPRGAAAQAGRGSLPFGSAGVAANNAPGRTVRNVSAPRTAPQGPQPLHWARSMGAIDGTRPSARGFDHGTQGMDVCLAFWRSIAPGTEALRRQGHVLHIVCWARQVQLRSMFEHAAAAIKHACTAQIRSARLPLWGAQTGVDNHGHPDLGPLTGAVLAPWISSRTSAPRCSSRNSLDLERDDDLAAPTARRRSPIGVGP